MFLLICLMVSAISAGTRPTASNLLAMASTLVASEASSRRIRKLSCYHAIAMASNLLGTEPVSPPKLPPAHLEAPGASACAQLRAQPHRTGGNHFGAFPKPRDGGAKRFATIPKQLIPGIRDIGYDISSNRGQLCTCLFIKSCLHHM